MKKAVEREEGGAGSSAVKRIITSHLGANKKLNKGPKFGQKAMSKSNKGPDQGQKRPQTGDLRDFLTGIYAAKRGDGQKSGEKVVDRGTFSKGGVDKTTGGTFVNHGSLHMAHCTFHFS